MLRTRIGYALSGGVGVAIIAVGARFLAAPQTAAAGYGLDRDASDPYLAVKAVRDIASGVVTFILIAAGEPRTLGRYMIAASVIPVGDAAIVLGHGGPKSIAYGVHAPTAAVMLATAALLLDGVD